MKKERTNENVKIRGNGEGTIYFSEALNKYVAQYVEPSTGKRKTLTQRKNEEKKKNLKIDLLKALLMLEILIL